MLESPDKLMLASIPWAILYSAELRSEGQFENLTQDIVDHWAKWKEWATAEIPYEAKLPGDWEEKLNNFDKLILIKGFRPEKLQYSMVEYIMKEMGKFYVESPSVSMDAIYDDINTYTPLIFVLSAGADPTSQLIKFATERGFLEKLNPISLGQGQGPKAESLITSSIEKGEWVML